MNRPIRIGLIAEGEAELGASISYIKPEDGGKAIELDHEGALHTLIRRELRGMGLDCVFIQRHPQAREARSLKRRTGHSVLDPKYLAQVTIAWKPEEIDMILLVVDADDVLTQRQQDLQRALAKIRENHLDENEQPLSDRSTGGLAICNFETWLLADGKTIVQILEVELEECADLSKLEDWLDTKERLEKAIAQSSYLVEPSDNQRPLKVRWQLATQIELSVLKTLCPNGYAAFAQSLAIVAEVVVKTFAA
jgi:hypothetical protein